VAIGRATIPFAVDAPQPERPGPAPSEAGAIEEEQGAAGVSQNARSALTRATARFRRQDTVQPVSRVLVAAAYPDQVQAEEAARALEPWRRANPSLGLGPAAVLVKRPSKTLAYHPQHLGPGGATVRGLWIGLVLFALPAAGAAALVAFLLGTLVVGLLGLIGAVEGGSASFLRLVMIILAVFLAALISGALGAGIGSLVGLVVGLVNDRARGFADTRRNDVARGLKAGASAVLLWSGPFNTQVLEDELRRLGGEPRTLWPGPPASEAFTGGQQPFAGEPRVAPAGTEQAAPAGTEQAAPAAAEQAAPAATPENRPGE
jgi:uncharacterized membrane protein